ncbi:hypothetical protein L7F22_058360 [Adiantum nelumboides]|nr:hypothetical protein [Adiantum nelumboides]
MAENICEFLTEAAATGWTTIQNKLFEMGLALHDEIVEERWEKIAELVEGKSAEDVKRHYELLLEDVENIEADQILLPKYTNVGTTAGRKVGFVSQGDKEELPAFELSSCIPSKGTVSRADQGRKKGTPWSPEEHRQGLLYILLHCLP